MHLMFSQITKEDFDTQAFQLLGPGKSNISLNTTSRTVDQVKGNFMHVVCSSHSAFVQNKEKNLLFFFSYQCKHIRTISIDIILIVLVIELY